ncbi:2Fe-2S ferredoxin-type domain-containing protein, partial [Haematococcus lacustris]
MGVMMMPRGVVQPAQWTVAEQLRLNFPPHSAPGNTHLRLACQVRCVEDISVTKFNQFWGQGPLPLPPLAAA